MLEDDQAVSCLTLLTMEDGKDEEDGKKEGKDVNRKYYFGLVSSSFVASGAPHRR